MTQMKVYASVLQIAFQRLAMCILVALALVAVAATLLAAAGVLPWISLPIGFGGEPMPEAGMAVQIATALLLVSILFFLPTNARVMALETSHRRFEINMHDVARAYHAAHAADRKGVFRLPAEFDAVKERLKFLRNHPELGSLEPDILEIAAQMSHVSRELAELYDEDRVERARTFLRQRQEEIDDFNARIEDARIIMNEIRQWSNRVEIEEDVARSQIDRLREELYDLVPELAHGSGAAAHNGKVVMIPHAAE